MHLDLLRDKSATFPSAEIPAGLDSLCVWHCKYRTLRPIADLRHLRALKIASFPDDTLEFLSELKELEWLSILHLPKVTSLLPIGQMRPLRWLELQTLPSWDASGKRTIVESLGPLADLPVLQHVSLLGVVPESRSLQDLQGSRILKTARLLGFPRDVVANFFAETAVQNAHIPAHALQAQAA
jgi:hypothetical protein